MMLCHVIKFMNGIRQGGILSGLCFNIYVSPLINKLRYSGSSCKTSRNVKYLSCNWCRIAFNPKKSHLCAFGGKTVPKTVFYMGAMNIPWFNKFQYLGVILVGGKSYNIDVEINRTKFLETAYAILNRCGALSEEIKIQLISS